MNGSNISHMNDNNISHEWLFPVVSARSEFFFLGGGGGMSVMEKLEIW